MVDASGDLVDCSRAALHGDRKDIVSSYYFTTITITVTKGRRLIFLLRKSLDFSRCGSTAKHAVGP